MKIETSTAQVLLISGAKALDPITVITHDFEPGKGRIWISCFTRAWVGYWGAMGSSSIRSFFCICNTDYLADDLAGAQRQTKVDRAYLVRVIEAVQQALIENDSTNSKATS
jgi:hypothetical protein